MEVVINKGMCSGRQRHEYPITIYFCIFFFIYHHAEKAPSLNRQCFISCSQEGAKNRESPVRYYKCNLLYFLLFLIIPRCWKVSFFVVIEYSSQHILWWFPHFIISGSISSPALGCVFLVVCLWIELNWHKQRLVYCVFPVAARSQVMVLTTEQLYQLFSI